MGLRIYQADEVTVNFGGLALDGTGLGDDEFVRIEQQEDDYSYKPGVDGTGTRSKNNNQHTLVTITLAQSNPMNAVLSALRAVGLATPGGSDVVPIFVRDRQGSSVFAAAESWITKPPDQAFAKESGTREWVIGCHNPQNVAGGN